jgi:glycosyltransferase involved in cell wall biosynthesis
MRVVTVGRVVPQKDPEMFAEIVSVLRTGGPVDATWVGDGPARGVLEDIGVAVTGWQPVHKVPELISSYTVYLHTAGWEAGCPIAVLEAMAAGVVVAVRRNPAYKSVLPEEWQFDDVSSAVRLIRELAEEPERRYRVREQFDLIAELRKSSPEMVLAAAYRETLRKSRSAPTSIASTRKDL